MAPALVAAAVGALLAAALLGPAFDRRAVLAVVAAAVLPSLDAILSLAVEGATNAALHTVFVPALLGAALHWDASRGADSAVRRRLGWRGVRVAWVALASYLVAGIGLALCTDGANLLYPMHDRFYVLSGELSLSSVDGVVQTYVGLGGDGLLPLSSEGTTANYHVGSLVNPDGAPGFALGAERQLVLVESGWQVAVVATAVGTLAARSWLATTRSESGDTATGDSPRADSATGDSATADSATDDSAAVASTAPGNDRDATGEPTADATEGS